MSRAFALAALAASTTGVPANLQKLGFSFPVVKATDAGIRAAMALVDAVGGGTVLLPDAEVRLLGPLRMRQRVSLVGVAPRLSYTGNVPDSDWTVTGGSRLVGDGTFDGLVYNEAGADVQDAVNFGSTSLGNVHIRDISFRNFRTPIALGSKNLPGLMHGSIKNIYVRDCKSWGINLENFMHSDIRRVFICDYAHGARFAASGAQAVLMPGNVRSDTIICITPKGILSRNVVFEAYQTRLNELKFSRVQVNRFGNYEELAVVATFTGGSANVAVPDTSKFAIGLPVVVKVSGFGMTTLVTHFVLSIDPATNTLTLGQARTGAALVASGSATGTNTLYSWGMPQVEIVGYDGGYVQNSRLDHVDMEGRSAVSLFMENTSHVDVDIAEVNAAYPYNHVVGRNAQNSIFFSSNTGLSTDFDVNTGTTLQWYGARGVIRQNAGVGIWRDGTRGGLMCFNLRPTTTGNRGDIESRGGNRFFLPRLMAMGQTNNASNVDGITLGNMGMHTYAGGAAATWNLPEFTDATENASMIGAPYTVINASGFALTLRTTAGQLFNGQAGKTSVVIPAGGSMQCWGAKDAGGRIIVGAFMAAALP